MDSYVSKMVQNYKLEMPFFLFNPLDYINMAIYFCSLTRPTQRRPLAWSRRSCATGRAMDARSTSATVWRSLRPWIRTGSTRTRWLPSWRRLASAFSCRRVTPRFLNFINLGHGCFFSILWNICWKGGEKSVKIKIIPFF